MWGAKQARYKPQFAIGLFALCKYRAGPSGRAV